MITFKEFIIERGADSKGYYRSTEDGAGLTPAGAKHFGVKTAVTGSVKPGSRRQSAVNHFVLECRATQVL